MRDGVLGVAQVGCGAFAVSQDLRNFRDNPRTRLLWCCDVDKARAQSVAQQFGALHATQRFEDVVADPDVDLIKIATTHEVHVPIIEAASRAGKHVFCEKPMAMDDRESWHILRAVRRGGIKLCVDYNRRMAPALLALKARWQAHCADPRHQPWRFRESDRDPMPEELRTHFLVRIQDDTASYRITHLDPLRGGGEIMGESCHWLDLACWLFAPQRPVEIQAWGSSRLGHGIHLMFESGDDAVILFNTGGTFDYPKELYEIASHGALFRCEHFVENQYYGLPGPERETFALQRDCLPDVGVEGGLPGFMKKYAARVRGLSNSKEGYSELLVDKGHLGMLNGFVAAIVEERPSPCDEMAGHQATHLAALAIRAIEQRQTLPVLVERLLPVVTP